MADAPVGLGLSSDMFFFVLTCLGVCVWQAEAGGVALVRACVGVLERGSQADLLAAVVQALRHMGTDTQQ